MSPAVNRSSELPPPSENQPPESSPISTQPGSEASIEPSQTVSPSNAADYGAETTAPQRQQPIPPPSDPKQYRAIGLIRGKYQNSQEHLTQGTLLTSEETAIDAVLLGRTISLVKNHLDLEQPHLWVVYPRTRQKDDLLHVQIVGVWEPETLERNSINQPLDQTPEQEAREEVALEPQHGYFSIRGEAIYYSPEKETAIIKIKQSPKRESEKPKFFKLKLKGILPDRAVGHFWDLRVQLQENDLVIQEAIDIGPMPVKKKPFQNKGGKRFPPRGDRHRFASDSPRPRSDSRPMLKGKPEPKSSPSPNRPTPKPTKRPFKKNDPPS